jgi:hypothetical protein
MPRRKKIETDEERDARIARQVIREGIRELFASLPRPPEPRVARGLGAMRMEAAPSVPEPRTEEARTGPRTADELGHPTGAARKARDS